MSRKTEKRKQQRLRARESRREEREAASIPSVCISPNSTSPSETEICVARSSLF